jgi:hypothetical protein
MMKNARLVRSSFVRSLSVRDGDGISALAQRREKTSVDAAKSRPSADSSEGSTPLFMQKLLRRQMRGH